MGNVKTEIKRVLSAEAVQLINEIWELHGHVTGKNPTAAQMQELVQDKDEYQLRKLALQLRDKWRGGAPKTQKPESTKEGGEGIV